MSRGILFSVVNPYLWDIVLESCKKKNQNEVYTANIENYHELQFEWSFDNSKSGR